MQTHTLQLYLCIFTLSPKVNFRLAIMDVQNKKSEAWETTNLQSWTKKHASKAAKMQHTMMRRSITSFILYQNERFTYLITNLNHSGSTQTHIWVCVCVLDAELPDRLHIKVFDPNTADVEMWMPYNSLNPYDLVFSEALSHYATHVKDTKPALWNLLYIRILHL